MEARRAVLIVLNGRQVEQAWEVTQSEVVIGRDAATCHVILPHAEVSRRHAKLTHEEDSWWLTDLNSRNGTRVNGQLVQARTRLHDRDEIELAGKVKLLFQLDDATVPISVEASAEAPVRTTTPTIGIALDRAGRRVFVNGKEVLPPLSPQQYLLLLTLVDANGAVVSRDALLDTLHGPESEVYPQALDALVRRLRERLRELDAEHEYVRTVRGHGLRFVNRPQADVHTKAT